MDGRGRELAVWGHPLKISKAYKRVLELIEELGPDGGRKSQAEEDALRAASKAAALQRTKQQWQKWEGKSWWQEEWPKPHLQWPCQQQWPNREHQHQWPNKEHQQQWPNKEHQQGWPNKEHQQQRPKEEQQLQWLNKEQQQQWPNEEQQQQWPKEEQQWPNPQMEHLPSKRVEQGPQISLHSMLSMQEASQSSSLQTVQDYLPPPPPKTSEGGGHTGPSGDSSAHGPSGSSSANAYLQVQDCPSPAPIAPFCLLPPLTPMMTVGPTPLVKDIPARIDFQLAQVKPNVQPVLGSPAPPPWMMPGGRLAWQMSAPTCPQQPTQSQPSAWWISPGVRQR